jgi:coenzyme PQQ precursor peptide PqqA
MLTSTCTPQGISQNEVVTMVWTAPVFEEVSLCCEINSYVSAKL